MTRRWLVPLAAVVVLGAWSDSAHAQRGRRGGVSMTPYGPMPGGVSMEQYSAVLQQRQYMQMMQQQAKLEQAWMKQQQQLAKQQQQQAKKGDAKKDDPPKPAPRPLTLKERIQKDREKIARARSNLGLDSAEKKDGATDKARDAPKP